MGLMLSVLVMCVGVLEAISAVQHIRESYLPLEFKRKKRRMVMDMGTGTVRHVDISWPGDVPRGSHVIRRRSGMQSPHSSLDLPDEDLPRRTSVHFDPVQLERAMSEILLEEEPSNETSEETSISSSIVQTRLEFSTRHTTKSAAVPINELRQETEQLPGNRPSLAPLREADLVDPKTPVPRTNRPPSDPIAKNDSVTFSEKISTDRVIISTEEFSPKNQLTLRDVTVSPLSTKIPESPHELHKYDESSSSTTEPALVITASETQLHHPLETEKANQEDITHVQDSPLVSPVSSETEGSITSVTEISGSISTNSLILDESTDKSEEDIPKDEPNRASVDRLESIEELIKSTNNIIIRQDSKLHADFDGSDQNIAGVIEPTEFVEKDSVGSKTDTEFLLDEPIEPAVVDMDTKSIPSSLTEAEIASALNESDDSENSVRSVVQTLAKANVSNNEQIFSNEPSAFHLNVLPEAVPETWHFKQDEGKSILPELPTHGQGIDQLPADQAGSSTNLVAGWELPCHKEDSPFERGLSHDSTISLESVEESSTTSLESQGLPSLPSLNEKRGEGHESENDFNGDARAEVELEASEFEHHHDSHELIEEPDAASLQRHIDLARANSQYSEAKVSNQKDSGNENDELSIDTERFSGDSESEPLECCAVSVASFVGDYDLKTKQVSPDEVTEHVVSRSESQKGNQKNDDSILDGPRGMKDASAWPKTDEAQYDSKDEVEENLAGQSEQVEESYDPKSSIAKGAPRVDVNVISGVHETNLDATRNVLDTGKNDMVKRKSLIETESIVISTHQIENDEHVSAQRANKSNGTQSATMVNCEDACTLQESTISQVSGLVSQSTSNDEPPATGADFEDVTVDTKIDSNSDANGKSVAEQSSQLGGLESTSESEMDWGTEKNDTVKRKSLIETENVVISTHKIENDEHVSPQRANQSNETQSAAMVDCEHTFTLQEKVIPSGSGQISQFAGNNEEAPAVETDFGDVAVNTKIDISSQAIGEVSADQSSQHGQLASTSESEISKSSRHSHVENSETCKEGVTAAQTDQNRADTDDLRIRDDGPTESNSNEIPTKTDQSNASEVKQETKSVSAIEESEGEVVKVAPTAPAEPEMEDIQVPTADTSPNKAFWVRD